MTRERCDIILPTIGQAGLVTACIESVIKHTKYPFRLIVVDDGAPAGMAAVLDSLAKSGRCDMRLVRPKENLGWIRAVNRGIEESKDSKYACFLNDDTVATEGWLEELALLFENDPKIGIANPEWELPKGADIDDHAAGLKKYKGESIDTDYCRGHCFFIRREVIDRLGGFDSAYIPAYYDDRDYSLKAIVAGYRCVKAKGSFVYHVRNVTMMKAMDEAAVRSLMERNGRIFYGRWGYPLRVAVVLRNALGSKPLLQRLCLDQNKVIVMTPQDGVPYEHTNMKVARFGKNIFSAKALAFLAARRSTKKQKKIDFVFTDDMKFAGLARRLKALVPAPVVAAEDPDELRDQALALVKEMKEKERVQVS